jgi:N-acetylglucosaminyl-diphospho-decaprenol L-rhamnosyltransferase
MDERDVDAPRSITLITVTYNSASTLEMCWREFDPAWADWVVVDNASSDNSAEVAERLGATVVRLSRNVGFSAANNVAARTRASDVIIFCNPDVTVDADGIRQLAERAVREPCLVAPQLVNPDGSPQENGRGAPYPHRKLRHMVTSKDDPAYYRFAAPGERREVVWVMGAAVALSRETFERIGGWNDKYFIYYEDSEICLRALRLGVPTYVDGDVRWVHQWARETRRSRSWNAWKHELRSGSRFYLTHPSALLPIGRFGRTLRLVDRRTREVEA